MVQTLFQSPLAANVRVVNPDGTPTGEFLRKWQQQVAVNSTITVFQTAGDVSSVLDLIGASPGSLLLRTTSWIALATANDATRFLNGAATPAYVQVKDSDLATSDITTNNVSITKHGFAPKLPNNATLFLNGVGGYTVPPGANGIIRVISGTSDTPTVADAGYYLRCTSASATTITIPPNAAQAFAIKDVMVVEQGGAGAVTIVPGAGVTINTPRGSYTVALQYGVIQIKKIGINEWTLLGDLGGSGCGGGGGGSGNPLLGWFV